MPIPNTLKPDLASRLPGVLVFLGTLGAYALLDSPGRIAAGSVLSLCGFAWLAARPVGLLTIPSKDGDRPDGGAFTVGHTARDGGGTEIAVRWSALGGGVIVEGRDGTEAADLLYGIGLQAAALGRPVIVLSLGKAGKAAEDDILRAVERAGLIQDLRTFGGRNPNASIDPFSDDDEDAIAAAVAAACPGLHGDTPAAVQARLLLPVACSLFSHLSEVSGGPTGIRLFDLCIGVEALETAAKGGDGVPPETRARALRYLASMPGYVSEGRQPSSLLWAHAAAENVLRDGLSRIEAVAGKEKGVPPRELLTAGRIGVLRHAPTSVEAGYVLRLLAACMSPSHGQSPLVVVPDIDALPGELCGRVLSMAERGATLVAGSGSLRDRSDIASFASGCGIRIALNARPGASRRATLRVAGARPRRIHPLPLCGSQRKPDRSLYPSLWKAYRHPSPPGREEISRRVLSILLSPDIRGEDLVPHPAIEAVSASLLHGPEGADRVIAEALAGIGEVMPDAPTVEGRQAEELEASARAAELSAAKSRRKDAIREEDVPDAHGSDAPDPLDFPDFARELFEAAERGAAGVDPERGAERIPDGSRAGGRFGPVVFPDRLREDPGLASGDWARVAGRAIPLSSCSDALRVRAELEAEFPHLDAATGRILGWMGLPGTLRSSPILLVGPTGAGKTRYARRLLEALRMRWGLYPCGGAPEGGFVGAPRQWSGARPGYVAATIARERVANPGVLLDGLDEGPSDDGQLWAVLRSLMDPEVAARYHDPYLDAPIDVSHVVWLATATDPSRLPQGLLDRFRVVAIEPPASADAHRIAVAALRDADRDGLCAVEYGTIVSGGGLGWTGGSLRGLRLAAEEYVGKARDEVGAGTEGES